MVSAGLFNSNIVIYIRNMFFGVRLDILICFDLSAFYFLKSFLGKHPVTAVKKHFYGLNSRLATFLILSYFREF